MGSVAFLPWLPADAIVAAARALPMNQAIADWSAKWFGFGAATVFGMAAVSVDQHLPDAAMELADGLALAVPDGAAAALGAMMYGEPGDAATPADLIAIAAATDLSIADLRLRLAQLMGVPRDAPWAARDRGAGEPGHVFRIRLGHAGQPLTIFVADRLLVRNVKSRLRPNPAGVPLGTIATGLASHPITLSALLGEARLSMADLSGLVTGDVIVLDRRIDGTAALVIDAVPQPAACHVAPGDRHLDLTLV